MKHLIFVLGLLTIVGCKDRKTSETTVHSDAVENALEVTDKRHSDDTSNIYGNAWTKDMAMDNGEQWQADVTTNEGVKQLQKTFYAKTTNSLEDYHKLAENLNEDKNYVVKNCTMVGPSHDNLHVWLHPLIEKIAALSKVETVEDASKLKLSIEENINAYSIYFK
ncbi:hypothetical protein ES711_09860 [Gelidibacter salicanalis]|uniref:DUF3347 domain-containing protein n=1 Tax=Gelidibacter salicanalis TaxID=291193 RepID=A0A5C7AHD5_9FLAO|nr:hypothetical protein [Gelidibacter salicanalis]TXE07737.1 hypothetical protein ES711_09860 [Gelidibacter salicanalis]